MNIKYNNPRDPKYQEFHNGEHEYNPKRNDRASTGVSAESGKKAALASGMKLFTAVASIVMVIVVLANLYVNTSPVSIGHDSTVLNVAVEDNPDDLVISYTLAPEADNGNILALGNLEGSRSTLRFEGLQPNTAYILTYYADAGNGVEKVGSYRFVTGQMPQGDIPGPTVPAATTPAPTTPEPTTPASTTPAPTTPAPTTPAPTTPAPTTPEPTTTAPPVPTALAPEISSIVRLPAECGDLSGGKHRVTQCFSFADIPQEEYTVTAVTGGGGALKYTAEVENNILYVYVERTGYAGYSYTTEVTVTWASGASCSSSHTFGLPSQ